MSDGAPADPPASDGHVRPYVHDDGTTRSLNFSMLELQSRMRLGAPFALDLAYTRTMMGFLWFDPAPARLAMIGLGGGSLAKFCHRCLPDTRIVVAEINPHVIALRERFMVPPDDPRFQVVEQDGSVLVEQAPATFDVLMVDGFDYDGQPEALCSQSFYDAAAASLVPQGVLVANLHTGHPDHERLVARLERSFGGLLLEVRLKDGANSVVFGFRSAATLAGQRRALRRPAPLDPAAWGELKAALGQVAAALQQWRVGPLDRTFRPPPL